MATVDRVFEIDFPVKTKVVPKNNETKNKLVQQQTATYKGSSGGYPKFNG